MGANYKETLNLPKTDFPMKAGLVDREPERLAKWERDRLYENIQAARAEAPLFVLHDGPPFANGDVHMGTAMNKILKDIIIKSKTMSGFRAPFVPGWDCHGLPIEFKVVKESRGLSPLEVRKKSEAYARKFIDIQRAQFKRLGVFGDWENPYLTLDPTYEAEILRAFAVFVEEGLVYQAKKPVLWSTGAQTALAEAEVEYAQRTDPAIYVKFALSSGKGLTSGLSGASFVVWTTTPWTLPANVAIAVQPKAIYSARNYRNKETGQVEKLIVAEDLSIAFATACGLEIVSEEISLFRPPINDTDTNARVFGGQQFVELGLEAEHPFLNRKSRVITADFVTMETGTGTVHIAPGHGKDDYIAGQANGLPVLSPVDDFGKFTEDVGVPAWVGKYVFDANAEIVTFLRESGALLAEQKYTHDYPHCWRSKTPIVLRAVEQFFMRIDAFRAEALAAIDTVAWLPQSARNRIYGTVESRPDWCISRQRSWGVPLPVFYDAEGKPILDPELVRKVADLVSVHGSNIWFELDDATLLAKLGLPAETTRRNDTLDVWIDSGVSHEAVLRKRAELAAPADVYIEGTDQHRGWFQSSLLTSVALHGAAPYKTVITNGFIVDLDGRKISKSSEYKKPMTADHFVGKYGADIVRLWVSSVNYTDEVPFSEEIFTRIVDTYRRMRNTLRILLGNLSDFEAGKHEDTKGELPMVDAWILGRLQEVTAACREGYASYEFHKVYHALNQFCAVDLSSLYVDITKDRMYCDAPDSPRRRATQSVMRRVLETLTQLLAPILPYTADETWEFLGQQRSVHLEDFPDADSAAIDPKRHEYVQTLLELRGLIGQAVEQARQEKKIGNALEGAVTLHVPDDNLRARLAANVEELEEFFIVSELVISGGDEMRATIQETTHLKCSRCWRHRPSVGLSAAQPELCARCEGALAARSASAR